MTKYNLSFLELMRVIKVGDRFQIEYFPKQKFRIDENGQVLNILGSRVIEPWEYKYRIIKPELEMVELIRPLAVKRDCETEVWCCETYFETKADFYLEYPNRRVFKWETVTVPKNFEDWEGGDESKN